MKRVVSKLHWHCGGVLVALALAVGILGLLLLGRGVNAEGPQFNASVSTDVSDTECLANADIDSTFNVDDDPWPAAQYDAQVSFTPNGWGVPQSADIPIGALVGQLIADATLGWFNSPCSSAYGGSLHIVFDPMMNCSIDTSDTVSFDDQFADANGNGIPNGCDQYPEFLNTMFPGMTPRTRHAAFENIGINVSLNFMTFEPGTTIPLPGMPAFSPDLGYVAMSVLNDPTAPLVPNQITDNCPPLTTATVYYGLTLDNPNTSENEAGYEWRTNPAYEGTYTFNGYAASFRDADGDGIDNELDTCPHVACLDISQCNPVVRFSGDPDNDGLDSACDPDPNTLDADIDGDTFPNRQDNCPLVDNEDQADADFDAIGDACDQDDWNDDGDITDPGEPTGFISSVPNGDKTELWFDSDFEISGSSCLVAGEDSDGDGYDDADEQALGSCRDDPCPDEEFCSDTEAADSTPEDQSIAGSCSDGLDNDLDGYVDDIDGGCGDDTDGDGVSDDGEDDLGSDPEDPESTPEHISVCDVCTDGVDNDGDEGTDAADEDCAAEGTPTVVDTDGDTVPDDVEELYGSDPEDADSTPESLDFDPETCSDGVDNDGDGLTDDEDPGCEEVAPTPTEVGEYCSPVFPGTYNGLVRVEGQPAAGGYEVTASIGGVEWGSALVSGGRYAMDIPDHMPTEPPCFEGGTITFALDDMECTPTADWASGIHNVDLSCEAAPPATPTTPEVTPTPTITPTTVPPTGAGGFSESGPGLPVWALALASWAGLTMVAGLGTLVAAKRR